MARKFLCRLGFHRMVQTEQLITTGRCRCLHCGEEWITSLFGDFPAQAMSTGTAKTAKPVEGRGPASPVGQQADAPNPSRQGEDHHARD